MQSLQAVTPSKGNKTVDLTNEGSEVSSEEATCESGGIQITQDIVTDERTGKSVEETKVTFSGTDGNVLIGGEEGLIGSEQQARKAAEDALELIENLKSEGVLKGGSGKRSREEDVENIDAGEDEIAVLKPGAFKRWFGRKPKAAKMARGEPDIGQLQVMQSPDGAQVLVAQTVPPLQPEANRRRYIAMAGMVVMGAAT